MRTRHPEQVSPEEAKARAEGLRYLEALAARLGSPKQAAHFREKAEHFERIAEGAE